MSDLICPKCSNMACLQRSIGCCAYCGEPLRKEGNTLVLVEPGFIADTTVFITNLSKLKPASNWTKTHEGHCCVCGNQATKKENINIKTITGQVGSFFGPTNTTSTSKYEVGYCNDHKNGICFLFPAGFGRAKKKSECLLGFRSVDFYRDFYNQNKISAMRSA